MNPYIRMRIANKGLGEFRSEANTIWIYDAIASDEAEAAWWGGISPEAFMKALSQTDGPVTLRINSPGGSVFGAQAMVAAMRSHAYPITARIDSLAASAASVIAANCASCVMVPGSMQMIHRAWGLAIGNCVDLRKTSDLLEKIDGEIAAAYAGRAKADAEVDAWLARMDAETWYTASEAVEAGLADAVLEENTQRTSNRWDLSAFAAVPAAVKAELERAEQEARAAEEQARREAAEADRTIRAHRLQARLLATPI